MLTVAAAVENGSPLALLGIGAVLIAMVYSGGLYNPAVTLVALIRRWIGLREAIAYWLVQLGAGLLAAGVVRMTVDSTRAAATAAIISTGHTLAAAFAVELLVTFALCYMATSKDHRDDSYGLAIGYTTVATAFRSQRILVFHHPGAELGTHVSSHRPAGVGRRTRIHNREGP